MQTEQQVLSGPFIPNEVTFEILSYLITDIDTLKKPWSRTCRLFRAFMEKGLEKYCVDNGLVYQAIKNDYKKRLLYYKDSILPFSDFIECAVTRQTIHKIRRHEIFANHRGYPYIPSAICQLNYLSDHQLPTKDTLYMAMIVGNMSLCLSLIKDEMLCVVAKDFIKRVLKGEGTRFTFNAELSKYSEIFPSEILTRALARTFIACYEKLEKIYFNDLPSKEKVIDDLLYYKEFALGEACIKQWGVGRQASFLSEAFFKSQSSFNRGYQSRSAPLAAPEMKIFIHSSRNNFLRKGQCYFGRYGTREVLLASKENAFYQELMDQNTHDKKLLSSKALWVQLEDFVNRDPEYLSYLISQGVQIDIKVLKQAIESLDFCAPVTQEIIFSHIHSVLKCSSDFLNVSILKELLWNKVIQFASCNVIKATNKIVPLDEIAFQKNIQCVLENGKSVSNSIAQLYCFPTILKTMRNNAVQDLKANTVYALLKLNNDEWEMNWYVWVMNVFNKDDYQAIHTFQLLQLLLERKLLKPTVELFYAITSYLKRFLCFIYEDTHSRFDDTVYINLSDIIRFQWSALDELIKCDEIENIKAYIDVSLELQNSFKLFFEHYNPGKCNHLVAMLFCRNFRATILELIGEFFLQKNYPFLFKRFEKTNDVSQQVLEILLLCTRKMWKNLLNQKQKNFYYSIKSMSQLILKYQIREVEVMDHCLEGIQLSFQWDFLKPLMELKREINGLTHKDMLLLENCFDRQGYLLGPIGEKEVLELRNELRLKQMNIDKLTKNNHSKRNLVMNASQKFYRS